MIFCFLIPASSSAQWPTFSRSKPKSIAAELKFHTPEATLEQFCHAVRKQDWELEYRCYSNELRSRFTYMLLRSIDELSDEQDLMESALSILKQYEIPYEAFTRYPSLRSTNQRISADEHQRELQNRLSEWSTEIFPKVKDWPKIIRQLQPLLTENYNRHSYDTTHPSQSGLVHHLSFHFYTLPSDVSILEQTAEASIVAIVRDPDWQPLEPEPEPTQVKSISFSERLKQNFVRLLEGSNIRRPQAKAQLILEEAEWRVAVIPYR
jgi:hypothetical protein